MEEPELIKMLKYILLISSFLSCVNCHPLVTEKPAVIPIPIHHSGEQFDSVPSLIPASSGGSGQTVSGNDKIGGIEDMGSGGHVHMSPVLHISEIQDELMPNNTGGQKHIRQIHEGDPTPPNSPPPSNELCSIFQFFLEPRRYSRCRVSNTYADNERNEALATRTVELGQSEFDATPDFHRPISNEVLPQSDSGNGDSFHSESENREVESVSHRQIIQLPPRMELEARDNREPPAAKRYDQIEELHGGPPGSEEGHHLIGPPPPPLPPGPPPMFPKSSLDRTTIIVPERPCRRGERRDHKGYCRRIVRPAPSYQYGPPPPPPYGPSRPFRYYYSRFVSVPTLQFFIPAVP